MISIRNLRLVVGDGDTQVAALDDVWLDVAPGELLAVVGPSGSGKSSLLAVAGALLRPDAGEVVVDGVDIVAASAEDRTRIRREKIGMIFQQSNLIPSLTVLEQLLVVPDLSGRSRRAARSEAGDLLTSVGMGHRLGHRPHQLSGGERQRVGIARALMGRPALLLADEPTSALDHRRGDEIVRLLADETHRRGVASIMVTHDSAMLGHVDRVVTMEDGRLYRHAFASTPG